MKKAQKILIVGFGDIGKRVAAMLAMTGQYQIEALIRNSSIRPPDWKPAHLIGVQLLRGDLSVPRSLRKLAGRADTVLHFAPPPAIGKSDAHTRHLLAALSGTRRPRPAGIARASTRPVMLPRRIVYISTTGVYGNCMGEMIDETRWLKPASARARRRVDAERQLRKWGRSNGVAITVLRAPGIYAEDRLPLDRLRRQIPVLDEEDDVFTNHIHADDLARAAINALRQSRPKTLRVYNVVDDSQIKMGDFFDQVADACHQPRPPRISRQEAQKRIPPAMLSFMSESRRIDNKRIKRELKLSLRYPTISHTLRAWRSENSA